ncbi:hypothetical protein [Streptomyces sp. NPDC096012]|uniref:hypothetical protein n=1 Tax=Streptomyces sp. NPDC096012 TaxID=3155684 RepID=UPI00336A6047
MADERYKWLNRRTAERLLRGEPLEAVDASGRDQAEPLSELLGALSAEAARTPGELPGEYAALAAFRKAREAAEAERATAARADGAPGRSTGTPAHGAEVGLIRIAGPGRSGIPLRRPRWARPVRLALAAAVVAGTLGGVGVAAGSGVLPTPFRDEHPGPAASVTPETSGQPLGSASPHATPGGGPGTPSGPGAPASRGDASDQAVGPDGDGGPSADSGSGAFSGGAGADSPAAAAACRAVRDGRELDAGRKRALARLAGGSARVDKFCKTVLTAGTPFSGPTNGGKGDAKAGGRGEAGKGGEDKGNGEGGAGKRGAGKDKGHGKSGEQGDDPGGDGDAHPGKDRGGHGRHGRDDRHRGGGDRRHGALPVPADRGRPAQRSLSREGSGATPAPAHSGHPARRPAPVTPASGPTHTAP